MQPPSREVVLQLTSKRNAVPLPLIQPKLGIRLPPEKYCLTSSNFQFNPKPREKTRVEPADGTPPIPIGGEYRGVDEQGAPIKRAKKAVAGAVGVGTTPALHPSGGLGPVDDVVEHETEV